MQASLGVSHVSVCEPQRQRQGNLKLKIPFGLAHLGHAETANAMTL
jgi:hypothetical protein